MSRGRNLKKKPSSVTKDLNVLKNTNRKEKRIEPKRLNKKFLTLNIKRNLNKNSIIGNIILYITYTTIYIFNFLYIINLYSQTKSNKFNFYYFHYSKISLKIRGNGACDILGNKADLNFSGINHINKVYINGNETDSIERKYIFNQTDNFVELMFDDNLSSCAFMFHGCNKIIEINFSDFDTSQVTNMQNMFAFCKSLISLNLSNFNTSHLVKTNSMFAECSSLTLLDLSNFNTSNVTDMVRMFWKCSSLISLDLSNFNTSKISNMSSMFTDCSSLTSLNLSNFNTSQVKDMNSMFANCSSLTFLDLSNFNTSKITNMSSMFKLFIFNFFKFI